MGNFLYFDCFSGISGDMAIGALVDAGVDPGQLEDGLRKLNMNGEYRLAFKKVVKQGITATKFDVIVKGEPHIHRNYPDIVKLIGNAGYRKTVENRALNIFETIGKAEAEIHGIPLDQVHFHEVGAIDSILDIVGTAIAIDVLQPDRIFSSTVPVGNGNVHIDHGLYPVPAPATLEILKGIPIKKSTIQEEMTTPTGAGILSSVVDEYGPIPDMRVRLIGYGAGSKDFPGKPNVLRVLNGESLDGQ